MNMNPALQPFEPSSHASLSSSHRPVISQSQLARLFAKPESISAQGSADFASRLSGWQEFMRNH